MMKKSRRSRSCWEIFGHFLSFDPGVNWCVGLSHGRSGKSPVSWVLLSPSFQHSRQGEKQCKEPSFLVGSANIKSFLAPLPKQGLVSLYLSRHTAKSVLFSLSLSPFGNIRSREWEGKEGHYWRDQGRTARNE